MKMRMRFSDDTILSEVEVIRTLFLRLFISRDARKTVPTTFSSIFSHVVLTPATAMLLQHVISTMADLILSQKRL
jgi:hypothetical protein